MKGAFVYYTSMKLFKKLNLGRSSLYLMSGFLNFLHPRYFLKMEVFFLYELPT